MSYRTYWDDNGLEITLRGALAAAVACVFFPQNPVPSFAAGLVMQTALFFWRRPR